MGARTLPLLLLVSLVAQGKHLQKVPPTTKAPCPPARSKESVGQMDRLLTLVLDHPAILTNNYPPTGFNRYNTKSLIMAKKKASGLNKTEGNILLKSGRVRLYTQLHECNPCETNTASSEAGLLPVKKLSSNNKQEASNLPFLRWGINSGLWRTEVNPMLRT